MKRILLSLSVMTVFGVSYKISKAGEPDIKPNKSTTGNAALGLNAIIVNFYNQIDFSQGETLTFEAFDKAYRGYLNLRKSRKLNTDKPILTIADFSLSSTKQRLWIIDVNTKKVILNDYVAHGQGSGSEFATDFSNNHNSHQSSLGFYVTGDTYGGKHGTSLRLHGMDHGYNSAALERGVVIHGADYVSKEFIAGQKKLGRSWGCPAVSNKIVNEVIGHIKGGTCLFLYYPQTKYFASSQWLNTTPEYFADQMVNRDTIYHRL